MSESYEVNTLLDDVGRSDPIRVAKALQAARGRGEELAPLVVARLESVLADPEAPRWADEASPCFLPFLAAEYRATAAHVPIVRKRQTGGMVFREACGSVEWADGKT